MRRWFVLPLIALATPALASPKTVVPLDGAWQVRIDPTDSAAIAAHKREAKWLPAAVPGSVQQDLIAAHRVPDPFKGTNEIGRASCRERVWIPV